MSRTHNLLSREHAIRLTKSALQFKEHISETPAFNISNKIGPTLTLKITDELKFTDKIVLFIYVTLSMDSLIINYNGESTEYKKDSIVINGKIIVILVSDNGEMFFTENNILRIMKEEKEIDSYKADYNERPRSANNKRLFFAEPIWNMNVGEIFKEYLEIKDRGSSKIIFRRNIVNLFIVIFNIKYDPDRSKETSFKDIYIQLIKKLFISYVTCRYLLISDAYKDYLSITYQRGFYNANINVTFQDYSGLSHYLGNYRSIPILYLSCIVPNEYSFIRLFCTRILAMSSHPWLQTHAPKGAGTDLGFYGIQDNIYHDVAHRGIFLFWIFI